LEFPRELPGFLLIFIAGLMLIRLRETQIAAAAMALAAVGALGLAYVLDLVLFALRVARRGSAILS